MSRRTCTGDFPACSSRSIVRITAPAASPRPRPLRRAGSGTAGSTSACRRRGRGRTASAPISPIEITDVLVARIVVGAGRRGSRRANSPRFSARSSGGGLDHEVRPATACVELPTAARSRRRPRRSRAQRGRGWRGHGRGTEASAPASGVGHGDPEPRGGEDLGDAVPHQSGADAPQPTRIIPPCSRRRRRGPGRCRSPTRVTRSRAARRRSRRARPRRPSGIRREHRLARRACPGSSSAYIQAVRSERKTVGAIALTLILCAPHSQASALREQVDRRLGRAVGACSRPGGRACRGWRRRARPCRRGPARSARRPAARQRSHEPLTFASITACQSSTGCSVISPTLFVPEAVTTMSSAAVRCDRRGDDRLGVLLRLGPAGDRRSTSRARGPQSRRELRPAARSLPPASVTRAPAARERRAAAACRTRPVAPVTSAERPSTSKSSAAVVRRSRPAGSGMTMIIDAGRLVRFSIARASFGAR